MSIELRDLNVLEDSPVPEMLVTLCFLECQISYISQKERFSVNTLNLASSSSCLLARVVACSLHNLGSAGGRAGLSSLEIFSPQVRGLAFPKSEPFLGQ